MAVLGNVNIGYFTPDYTAYEQCLGLFLRISPSPLLHRDVNDALMDPKEFEFQVKGAGLGSVLLSNPANPTGKQSNCGLTSTIFSLLLLYGIVHNMR